MSDAASFDAVMQFSLLEVFCDALDAAFIVTDKLDEIRFASTRLLELFTVPESAIQPGARARDLYAALYDAGCRFGATAGQTMPKKENWVSERVAMAWKERVDTIERCHTGRWLHVVSKRFASGLGMIALQDISEHKKKEEQWGIEQERIRMTEHILDTLPVAVAIKDSSLHFAAVNEKFCALMNAPPESILGRSAHGFFKPYLADAIDVADRQLLETGCERQATLLFDRPDGTQVTLLHRARRIGVPGRHYLTMSLDELPAASETEVVRIVPAALDKRADLPDSLPLQLPRTTAEQPVTRRRVVYVDPRGASPPDLAEQAAADDLELCIVHNRREFAALLPALKAAGIHLDMVVSDASGGPDYSAFSRQQGVVHALLPAGVPVLDAIRAALDGPAGPVAGSESAPQPGAGRIDILAVDDNALSRMVLEQIFESLGTRFSIVDCGREALTRLAEIRPRLIFADMTLPDMPVDAWMPAIEAIYAEPLDRPPIVGLMSATQSDQLAIARACGFVHAIAKPLSPDAIDLMLRKYMLREETWDGVVSKNAG